MNTFHSNVIKSFNKNSESYNNFSELQFCVANNLCKLFTCNKQHSILDLGCGTGYIAQILKYKTINLDIAFNMCAVAKKYNNYNINARMESLPLRNHCMDVITSSLSIHWSDNIQSTIQEIRRVLKTNGKVLISIPTTQTFCELNNIFSSIGLATIDFIAFQEFITLLENNAFTVNTNSYTSYIEQHYNSFYDFIKSMKKTGTNINKTGNIIDPTTFNLISKLYQNKFGTEKKIKVSWEIGYILAAKC